VRDEIVARLPVSAYLAVGGAVVWLVVGVGVGIVSAMRRGSLADRASMGFTLLAISAPPYWLGLVLLYVFSRDGHVFAIFPGQGSCIDFNPVRCAPGFVLPWIALAMAFAAFYARLTRSSLLETLGEDYVRTARAKGMTQRRLVLRHGLRPALTPLLSVFGLDLALLLSGALLIETVFNLPGLGRYAFQAIREGDIPAVQGTVLFSAGFVVLANAVVDVLYGIVDPRVAHG
jgi:peptide/nickel transport system permease protein